MKEIYSDSIIQTIVGLGALIFGLTILLNNCQKANFHFEIAIISTDTKK